jgi:tol-pal system protein YbgF
MPEITDKEAYDKAYAQLKDGKYDQAEQAFLSFMEIYPNSSLLGNANYWLAETYYARSKWAEASGLFADGFTKYKDNIKAPDSMFKLGMTMKQMGKNKEACAAFKGLAGEFKNLSDNLKKRSEQEIKDIVFGLMVQSNMPCNIGVIMKHFKDNYSGQYDGKLVSQIAKEML